ncbi:nuclear receptor subfamily 5 group A member 2-like isoform X1 [Haliotis asinina]|uniref:nuclear receptor subfamily 5 group A member 2-like isoform X1 n=1 Tax=Haliotis asinina TaxID=109174 RepID=UPI003531F089
MIQTSEKVDTSRPPVVGHMSFNHNHVENETQSARENSVEASTSSSDAQYPPDIKSGFEELCPVCGDKVSGYHYGLLTCESCKGFFKRTVQNKKVYSCVDNRSCQIDKSQRKRCPYCRFQKCLSVGMKLEAVRSDRMRGGRNKFGPMYKRDRALKQQALRQQQQIVSHCQMRLANGMAAMPGSPEDIKPDPALLNISYRIDSPPGSMGGQTSITCPSPPVGNHNNNSNSNNSNSNSNSNGNSNSNSIPNNTAQHTSSPLSLTSHHRALSPLNSYPMSSSYPSVMDALRTYHPSTPQVSTAIMPPQLVADLKSSMAEEAEVKHKLLSFLQTEFGQLDVAGHPEHFLQLMCKMTDQLLFLMVEWARSCFFFKELKVEDQMKLLQNSWSEILILDLVFRQVSESWSSDIILASGHRIGFDVLDKLGLSDVKARIYELIKKAKDLKIDVYEYACLKFLILLNPDVSGLENRHYVEQSQEKVNAALLEYCLNFYPEMKDKFGQVLLRLPEIRLISIQGEEFLYYKHLSGEVPDQTLLLEMLHSKKK